MKIQEFQISYTLVKSAVRPSYIVLHDNVIKEVERIDKGQVIFTDGTTCNVKDASNNIVKFIASNKEYSYSIRHSSFHILVKILKQNVESENNPETTYEQLLLNGEHPIVDGFVSSVPSALKTEQVVKIVNIDIIDSMKLYNHEDRLANVVYAASGNVTLDMINLKNKSNPNLPLQLKVSRTDVKPVNAGDLFHMVEILCPVCNR